MNNEDRGDIVRLTGRELGEGLSFQLLRKAAKQFAQKNFVGKKVTVESNGAGILVSMGGIKHTLAMAKTWEDILAVIVLPELLRHSVKVDEEADKHGRKYIKAIEKYQSPLEIGGKVYMAEMIVTVVNGESRQLDDIRVFYHQKLQGPIKRS